MRRLDAAVVSGEDLINAAVASIAQGGIVVFPTDTVYGVLCDPNRPDAIAKIFAAKGRPKEKPLILLFGSVDDLVAFTRLDGGVAEMAARHFLPGPLTLVVARPPGVAVAVSAARAGVGVRVPDHPLLQTLLALTGPLASTSANVSGSAAYTGHGDFVLAGADLLVDTRATVGQGESTVIDFTAEQPVVLREGVLAKAVFTTWLGNLRVV